MIKRITCGIALCACLPLGADDPALLARNFTEMARLVRNMGGEASFAAFQDRQLRAIPLYEDFLATHPGSVYDHTVRWTLFTAYMSLDRTAQARQVLDDIQDSLLQELLRVAFSRRRMRDDEAAGGLLEGILEKSQDGNVRARVAQYLVTSGEDAARGLQILDDVIGGARYGPDARAGALLIKADLFRHTDQREPLLADLVARFPQSRAAREGARKLAAARLRVGSDAIPFEVQTTAGAALSLSGLRGKTVLLYFWATHSHPSWRHLADLKKVIAEQPAGSTTVIAVACESYIDLPKAFLAGQGVAWPLVAEGRQWHNTLALLYDVESLPTYVLIDRGGKIALIGTARIEELSEALRKAAN